MYFKEMTHYWHDRNRAVEELLEEVLDHSLEIRRYYRKSEY